MIGSADMIQNACLHLRQCVLDDFSNAPDLTWPPAPSDLTTIDDAIPSTLRRMLCYIITGKRSTTSSQSQRLIQSIGQDICRATTTYGSWKLPKHILMCMSLRAGSIVSG